MYTKNLKELSKLIPVASARVGNPKVTIEFAKNHFLTSNFTTLAAEYNPSGEFAEIVMTLIKQGYEDNRKYVEDTMRNIYDRPLKFSEKLGELLIKIKNFMVQTGKTIEQVIEDIRSYLDYKCSFNRYVAGRLIPVTSERILNAHKAVVEGRSFLAVEDALYL